MRYFGSIAMLATISVIGASAHAKPNDKKQADKSDEASEEKSSDTKEAEVLPDGSEQVVAEPQLAEPHAGDQFPAPVAMGTEAPARRWLSVGLDLAVLVRPSGADDIRYLPGIFWGGHVRAELMDYLGFRVFFTRGEHSVSVDTDALAPVQAKQDDVTVTSIGARLEPTLRVEERARLFLGLGVAWSRMVAPELDTEPRWRSFERSGVFLEWTAALGALFDVIPDRAGVLLSVQGGTTSNASGNAFDSVPAIDHNGLRTRIGGLPISDMMFGATVGVEAIF